MSMEHVEIVKCPECGSDIKTTIWQSLNAEISPEANAKLLDGSLFSVTCGKCGRYFQLRYPILYHNMTRNAMVQYLPNANEIDRYISEQKEAMAKMNGLLPADRRMDNYIQRVVTSQERLREKANILEHGLDDRIIEIIKLFYLDKWIQDRPTEECNDLIFWINQDGNYSMTFLLNNGVSEPFSVERSLYEGVYKDFINLVEQKSQDCFVIDIKWAEGALASA